jgi:glutathione S-transferase
VWPTPAGRPHFERITPFGQLPVLEHDGLVLAQSRAIGRYVGGALGLRGRSLRETARIDEVGETASELLLDLGTSFWRPDFVEKRAEHRAVLERRLAAVARYFERVRADTEHWISAGAYTEADVAMAYALETSLAAHPGLLESFADLWAFTSRFFATGRVAEYVRSARRPRTWTVAMAPFGGRPEETWHWGT